jgi:WD40 repeat protein
MLVSNLNTGTISKFDATTGAFLSEFATGIGGPTRMALGPDTLLYVLQWAGNGKVKRYKLDGTFVDDFTDAGVGTSIGLAWDAAGNLYVSSYNGKFVRKFSPTGASLGNFVASNLAGPTNIWFDANGDLLVVDYNGGTVKRFDSSGAFVGTFIAGLPQGEGVAFTPEGNIVLGCGGTSSVRVYDPAGTLLNDLVPPATLGLKTPNAVVFRPVAPSPAKEVYRDATFVLPTVGTVFRLAKTDGSGPAPAVEVFNSAGVLVQKINFADTSVWDATHLPAGVYHLVAKQKNGLVEGQQVVVQH